MVDEPQIEKEEEGNGATGSCTRVAISPGGSGLISGGQGNLAKGAYSCKAEQFQYEHPWPTVNFSCVR